MLAAWGFVVSLQALLWQQATFRSSPKLHTYPRHVSQVLLSASPHSLYALGTLNLSLTISLTLTQS